MEKYLKKMRDIERVEEQPLPSPPTTRMCQQRKVESPREKCTQQNDGIRRSKKT